MRVYSKSALLVCSVASSLYISIHAPSAGVCEFAGTSTFSPAVATLTAAHVGTCDLIPVGSTVRRCSSVTDADGESRCVGDWVVTTAPTCIGQVKEILQVRNSPASREKCADVVLLEQYRVAEGADKYGLPKLRPSGWVAISAQVCI